MKYMELEDLEVGDTIKIVMKNKYWSYFVDEELLDTESTIICIKGDLIQVRNTNRDLGTILCDSFCGIKYLDTFDLEIISLRDDK